MSFYETHELHKKEALRTRWFACSYDDAKRAVFDVAEELGYGIVDVNDMYQEFLIEGPATIVMKICSFGRYEQGIDMNITTHTFIDFGQGKRIITSWYEHLGRHIRLKGVSLHP